MARYTFTDGVAVFLWQLGKLMCLIFLIKHFYQFNVPKRKVNLSSWSFATQWEWPCI